MSNTEFYAKGYQDAINLVDHKLTELIRKYNNAQTLTGLLNVFNEFTVWLHGEKFSHNEHASASEEEDFILHTPNEEEVTNIIASALDEVFGGKVSLYILKGGVE